MRNNIIIYYVLMLLVVMGAFASMALNSYGVILMSYASLAFALVFLSELIFLLPRQSDIGSTDKRFIGFELIMLSALCALFFLRGMMIEFPFDITIGLVLTVLLLIANAYNFYSVWSSLNDYPSKLKISIVLYFAALFLLVIGGYLFNLYELSALLISLLAFVGLVLFVVLCRTFVIVNGERTNALYIVSSFKNKSGIQIIGLSLIVAYYSLRSLNVLPPLYFGSMPNGYSKVIQGAKKGGPDPKTFEEAYLRFIKGK